MNERLYTDLAPWWAAISPIESYADEAAVFHGLIAHALGRDPSSLLELGSGVGHLAANMPDDLDQHLVDLAPAMIEASEKVNPTLSHHVADMRSLAIGRTFDAVLLHDAVMYLLSEDDLAATFARVADHLEPGGVFVVRPDVTREEFEEGLLAGGRQAENGRAAQMMEWHWDPDPSDTTFRVDFAFLIREPDGTMACVHDPHTMGLFPHDTYAELMVAAGFELVAPDPELLAEAGTVFIGRKR